MSPSKWVVCSLRVSEYNAMNLWLGAKGQRNMGYISSNQEHNMCQQLSSLFGGIYMLFPGKQTLRKISATCWYDCGIEEGGSLILEGGGLHPPKIRSGYFFFFLFF